MLDIDALYQEAIAFLSTLPDVDLDAPPTVSFDIDVFYEEAMQALAKLQAGGYTEKEEEKDNTQEEPPAY